METETGTVTGTITVEGKPLAGVLITFYPEPEGRPSSGWTEDTGEYELVYTRGIHGAKVGEHVVRITTAVDSGEEDGRLSKETVPTKYNQASELKTQVKPGKNTINFELDFEGEVVQPRR